MDKKGLKPIGTQKIVIIILLLIGIVLVGLFYKHQRSLNKQLNNYMLEGPMRRAAGVMSECKKLGGSIQSPIDKYKGGGNICSLSNVSGNWLSLGSSGKLKYEYRTITDSVISGGTDSKDMVICYVGAGTESKCDLKQ